MKYVKVKWEHDFEDEPIIMYYEVDPEREVTRMVEIFGDGTMAYASKDEEYRTFLTTVKIPSIAEITAADPDAFFPQEIGASEFHSIWMQAQKK